MPEVGLAGTFLLHLSMLALDIRTIDRPWVPESLRQRLHKRFIAQPYRTGRRLRTADGGPESSIMRSGKSNWRRSNTF
jgi:hypothetical protein